MPSSIKGTAIISIPKSSSILKCLSNPGTGQINFGLSKSFQGVGLSNRYFARIIWYESNRLDCSPVIIFSLGALRTSAPSCLASEIPKGSP